MSFPIKCLTIFATILFVFSAANAKITHVEFYLHEIRAGPSPTVVQVSGRSNYKGKNSILAAFGAVSIMDNPLRATPNTNGTIIGRGQGLFALSSQEEISLLMSATYVFIAGKYNGSSFSVLGRNPALEKVREFPIVGGTGKFRLATGYCLVRSYSFGETDAIIGYNATLIHH